MISLEATNKGLNFAQERCNCNPLKGDIFMKKLLIGTALATSVAASAFAGGHGKEVTIGVFLGFTGPIEFMVAEMGPGAEFAISEVNDSGAPLDNAKVKAVRADTTCIDLVQLKQRLKDLLLLTA